MMQTPDLTSALDESVFRAIFVSYFLLGTFAIIGMYMLLLFFQQRKKDYLLYALYSLLFCLYYNIRIESLTEIPVFGLSTQGLQFLQTPLLFVITGVYVLFIRQFASLQDLSPAFGRRLQVFCYLLFGIALGSIVFCLLGTDCDFVRRNREFVLIPMHLYTLAALVRAFIIIKSKLRYYILLSNSFLLVFSVIGVYYTSGAGYVETLESNSLLGFYPFNFSQFGVLAEMLCFSLGLGYKFSLIEKEKEQIQQLDELKNRLYANISHELRTPLTLILGPVEEQLSRSQDPQDRKQLKLVQRNALRITSLVDQMLDLSRLESGNVQLHVSSGNFTALLKQLIASFHYQAEQKQLKIRTSLEEPPGEAWYDPDILEKIVVNLISNAVKHSPENGDIAIATRASGGFWILEVTNTVRKVDQDELSKMFDRFYRGSSPEKGFGIGLALVRELIALYRGKLDVQFTEDKAIRFTVTLPCHIGMFETGEVVAPVKAPEATPTAPPERLIPERADMATILVVEDSEAVRDYLSSLLRAHYRILKAADGEEGIQLAERYLPELIISDVMMPEADGIQLCNHLKHEQTTSHIPIILLTAKAGDTNEIAGLKTGADAYITKPFNREKLLARIEQLLAQRDRLRKHYGKTLDFAPEYAISQAENHFLDRLKTVIEKNLTDSGFTAEAFSSEMHMSRSQLHRKLQALTGMSATQFIRSQRIKLASELLQDTDTPVNGIAYQTGFNTPSYFIKCFREHYGVTPAQYRSKGPEADTPTIPSQA